MLAIVTLCMENYVEVAVIVVNIWTLKLFLEELVIMLVVGHYKKNGMDVGRNVSLWQTNIILIYPVNLKMRMLYS